MTSARIKGVGLLLAAFVALGTTAALPAHAGGTAYHAGFKGTGAEGFWSVCTETRIVSCIDTYISGAQQVTRADGTRWGGSSAVLDRVYYHFDENGNYVFDGEDFGIGNATVTVDSKLNTASISSNLPVSSCIVDETGNWICADTTVDLASTFGGFGDLTKVSQRYKVRSGSFTESYKFRGSSRSANSEATLDGTSLNGYQFGDIFNANERDMSLCHGC